MVFETTVKNSTSRMALNCSQAKAWVKTHYERNEDGVVAKSVMYKHYEDVCREEQRNIMETSIFGRVVKSVFPDVTIRRLGGRDNLKYYYCGIQAKEDSPYAIDNTTTTRPKRRLRKRELVTDKVEVHSCLRWLHGNYVASSESSVVKTDVYDRYVNICRSRGVEPLSIQYFGMVITHAFPSVTKRKLGPRSNQQKFYFGIEEKPNPMGGAFHSEYFASIDDVIRNGKSYRETADEEETDEDFSCRSPESDMSDLVYHHGHSFPGLAYGSEMSASPSLHPYTLSHFMKVESAEPVDYSLSSLRLKDEPIDDEYDIKDEPTHLHVGGESIEHIPDRPYSANTFVSSNSPSPPTKGSNSRRIYKPRFHYYNDESSWNAEESSEKKTENVINTIVDSASMLKEWLLHHFEPGKDTHVDRDQIYELYEAYCHLLKGSVLPMVSFDEAMLKVFRGVVTMIHPSGKTFYQGICVRGSSSFFGRIKDLGDAETHWKDEETAPSSMELSPTDELGTSSYSSPLTIDDDELPELEELPFPCNEVDDDDTTPEVLRDGKYYLRKWLTTHFYFLPDSCVLKADAYKHYEIYARCMNQTPFEMNVFGKIVRQVFPDVTIRRLGGRLKPQYHYCGIAVKNDSPLVQFMSGKDPAQRSRKKEIATDNRSAEIVLDFLRRNYEFGKHKIIMKCEVFDNYCALCDSISESPVTLNYFGKLVKHCFPSVEVRKFGGRSEPVWYYFGLTAKNVYPGLTKAANSLNKYGGTPLKDSVLPPPDLEYQPGLPMASRGSPIFGLDANANINTRHSTSPIPIALHRPSFQPMGHFSAESPSFLHSHLQASLRVSSYEDNSHGSPVDPTPFFRESLTPHSPADAFCPRSPVDHLIKGHPFHLGSLEILMNREGFPNPYKGVPHLGSGQVVPSQTPPNLIMLHNGEDTIIPSSTRQTTTQQKPFAIHEEYGIFSDMGME